MLKDDNNSLTTDFNVSNKSFKQQYNSDIEDIKSIITIPSSSNKYLMIKEILKQKKVTDLINIELISYKEQ
jgi:hypothetical protein